MADSVMFEIDLDTLRLSQVPSSDWPEEMRSQKTRMREECLETIIALNLDILFPGERLLLVATQNHLCREADVLCINPLGFLRPMEIKVSKTNAAELEDQVLSYALGQIGNPPDGWKIKLAQKIPYMPEVLALAREGFIQNLRAKGLGQEDTSFAPVSWRKLNRFEKADALVRRLKDKRRFSTGGNILDDPFVQDAFSRLYGLPVTESVWANPIEIVDKIIERWGGRSSIQSMEICMIAPGVDGTMVASLERRGVYFDIIDAELRAWAPKGVVERSILRWKRVHRTIPTHLFQEIVEFHDRLRSRHQEAAGFKCEGIQRFSWNHGGNFFMTLEEDAGSRWLVAKSHWLTEGLERAKALRHEEMRSIRDRLGHLGIRPLEGSSRVGAPWTPPNFEPAVELAVEYFELAKRLGLSEPCAWHLRTPVDGREAIETGSTLKS